MFGELEGKGLKERRLLLDLFNMTYLIISECGIGREEKYTKCSKENKCLKLTALREPLQNTQ